MTTIRFAGFPTGAETPRFGAHHGDISRRLYERALGQVGDNARLPDQIRLKTTAEKMGLEEKDAQLLTTALDPGSSKAERKHAVKTLEESIYGGYVLRDRAMLILVAAHAIIREQQEKGEKVSLPKPFLKKLLKTVAGFKYVSGRGSLLQNHSPKQYDGPAFPPDIEQEYLKVLLNNNHNDNIHDHENNFTRSVAKSSPENRKLALKEAAWMTSKLALELLEEAIPEEARRSPEHALPSDQYFIIVNNTRRVSPENEETDLATAQIMKRMETSYPKELGRSSLPQLGDAALDLLIELRQKQLPTMKLHYELLKHSLESPEFVLADGSRHPGDSYNKNRPYSTYLQGQPFPDQRLEQAYVHGLIGKARSFHFLAYLLDNAQTGAKHPYNTASVVSKRVKDLVDGLPPDYSVKSVSTLLEHATRLQHDRENRSLEAWTALDAVETEVPKELSEWLLEVAVPTRRLAFQAVPEKKDPPNGA